MTDQPPVDLLSVRQTLRRLDDLAAQHPELCAASNPENRARWEDILRAEEQSNMAEKTVQVAFRFPRSLVDQIDAYATHLNQQSPGWRPATRADAVRVLVVKGLAAEGVAGPSAPAPAARRRR